MGLWTPKVAKVSTVGIMGVPAMGIPRFPLGSRTTKCHLHVAPMEKRKEYYKGEGGGFPQVQAVVSLVSPRLLVARFNTQNAQTMH